MYLNLFPNLALLIRYRVVRDFDVADDNVNSKVDIVFYDYNDVWRAFTDTVYYIVVTVTSTGYGDVISKNTPEHLVMIVVIISGMYVYGYAIEKIKQVINLESNIANHHQEQIDAVDAMIVNMEAQRRRTSNKRVPNPLTPFVPIMWQCKLAHFLSIQHDAVRLFNSDFFEKLPIKYKHDVFDRHLASLHAPFSGVFKVFSEVLDYQLFVKLQAKV